MAALDGIDPAAQPSSRNPVQSEAMAATHDVMSVATSMTCIC